jgi:hypothetical protein
LASAEDAEPRQAVARCGDQLADQNQLVEISGGPRLERATFAFGGYSEPTIAAPVGHKGHIVASRYLHAADAMLLAATHADVVQMRVQQ